MARATRLMKNDFSLHNSLIFYRNGVKPAQVNQVVIEDPATKISSEKTKLSNSTIKWGWTRVAEIQLHIFFNWYWIRINYYRRRRYVSRKKFNWCWAHYDWICRPDSVSRVIRNTKPKVYYLLSKALFSKIFSTQTNRTKKRPLSHCPYYGKRTLYDIKWMKARWFYFLFFFKRFQGIHKDWAGKSRLPGMISVNRKPILGYIIFLYPKLKVVILADKR